MDQDVGSSVPNSGFAVRGHATRAERVASRVLITLDYLFALAPLLALGALYAASWRAMALIGHWPRPYADDPAFIGGDWAYQLASWPVIPFLILAATGIVMLPLLTFVLRRHYRFVALAIPAAVFALGLALVFLNIGDRLAWYMD